jgi:hypothetical protein
MSDLVIVRPEESGPTRVLPGGGKRLRFHDGHEVVIGGEALRQALRRRRIRKPLVAGGVGMDHTNFGPVFAGGFVADGKEMVVDVSAVAVWLKRGAEDLGPECVIVGEEPLNLQAGPSIADQQNAALRDQQAFETDIKTIPHRQHYDY